VPGDTFNEHGTIACGHFVQYCFSKRTLRYQAAMTICTRIVERDNPCANDTPYIEIGRCSAI